MMSGNFRSVSHVERKWVAKDHQPKWSITEASPAKANRASGRLPFSSLRGAVPDGKG